MVKAGSARAALDAGGDRRVSGTFCGLLVAASFLAASGVALACTSQDATAKRLQLSERVQSLMMQDPERGQALIRKVQAQMASNRQDSRELDWNVVCAQYDALLRQARCGDLCAEAFDPGGVV